MAVRPGDMRRAIELDATFNKFDSDVENLLGIKNPVARAVLVEQIIESLRRIEFVHVVRDGEIDPRRADPTSHLFDPIRAAAFRMRKGELDEAFWLVFLSTHFGKHVKYGWGLTRAVYGGSSGATWTWKRVSRDVDAFRVWLSHNEVILREKYAFSNHRKYQSLSAYSDVGTGAVVASYVNWVASPRSHAQMIQEIHKKVGQDPQAVFDYLYRSMDSVMGFGRLGKFDFLTMLGKLGLAPIEPGSAYLVGATGPLQGARLLFTNNAKAKVSPRELDARLTKLNSYLDVGMQVLEDSLCNWQKSPKKFISFRG
jgi:Alpha-glutamyl/putrescinyl thymine pyrophosphorylase clade 3